MLPAVAQGAIGIERRESDKVAAKFLEPIHHIETGQRLVAERAFLKELDGSCETPIAGLAVLNGTELFLRGEVLRPDGTEKLAGERRGSITDATEMALDLARDLHSQAGPEFFTWV
jgi:hydroxymethylbilane synthase